MTVASAAAPLSLCQPPVPKGRISGVPSCARCSFIRRRDRMGENELG